jgi:DNA (cytosine-5)-methyltransferase 1
MATFTELSLFSGGGGGLLATQHLLGFRTVCYVEWDRYAVDILKARIRDGYLHDAPIWDDAFTFDGRPWAGLVDIVSAGFPCQPFSLAGKGLAEHDPRNGWPAAIRILREVRPAFAFLENVPGLISKPYYRRILGDLAEAGYDIEQDCISAQEIGAPHLRERLWIIAHAEGSDRNLSAIAGRGEEVHAGGNGEAQLMADAESTERDRIGTEQDRSQDGPTDGSQVIWHPEHPRHRRIEESAGGSQAERDVCNIEWGSTEPDVG